MQERCTLCVHIGMVLNQQLCHFRVSVPACDIQRRRSIVSFCNVSGCIDCASGTYSLRSHQHGVRPTVLPLPCVRSSTRHTAVSVHCYLLRCEWLQARCKRDVPLAFTSAWCSTSSLATSVCPFWHARCSGIRPSLPGSLTSFNRIQTPTLVVLAFDVDVDSLADEHLRELLVARHTDREERSCPTFGCSRLVTAMKFYADLIDCTFSI
jgi:hypothetical protein